MNLKPSHLARIEAAVCPACEQADCVCCNGVDYRDPAYDPRHTWVVLGEADGTTFVKCSKCGKEIEQ